MQSEYPDIPNLNTEKFQAIGKSWCPNSAVFFGRSKFRSHKILLSPSFGQDTPIYPLITNKIWSKSDKVEISRIHPEFRAENEKSHLDEFFISAIVLRIPDIPYIPSLFQAPQESDKVENSTLFSAAILKMAAILKNLICACTSLMMFYFSSCQVSLKYPCQTVLDIMWWTSH